MSRLATPLELDVPKPKKDRPKRNDVAVKVDAEVIRLARTAAAFRELTLAEYLSEALRPIVRKDVDAIHGNNRGHR